MVNIEELLDKSRNANTSSDKREHLLHIGQELNCTNLYIINDLVIKNGFTSFGTPIGQNAWQRIMDSKLKDPREVYGHVAVLVTDKNENIEVRKIAASILGECAEEVSIKYANKFIKHYRPHKKVRRFFMSPLIETIENTTDEGLLERCLFAAFKIGGYESHKLIKKYSKQILSKRPLEFLGGNLNIVKWYFSTLTNPVNAARLTNTAVKMKSLDFELAMSHFDAAIKTDPRDSAHYMGAAHLLASAINRVAVNYAETGYQLTPFYWCTNMDLCAVLQKMGSTYSERTKELYSDAKILGFKGDFPEN